MIAKLFHFSIQGQIDWLWLSLAIMMLICLLVQLYYFFKVYRRLLRFKKLNIKTTSEPVSIIICARNEADNLKRFLPSVLNQFYPEFEVIVVNDGSTDDTEEVLLAFKLKYPNLYVTGIEHRENYPKGKKLAQTIGIKAAKYDQLLFTDADCEPVSPNWIRQMQSNFTNQTEIVLGYGAYLPEKSFLNKWIRIDTLYIAMQYFGMALQGIPFMGVGRNLAYRKSLFFSKRGFASHLHVQSGDDDLFVNEHANRYNTAIEIHPESFTYSIPKNSFKNWIRQKRRHLSTSGYYKKNHKRILGAETVSRELFYLLAIVLLVFWYLPGYIIIMILLRSLVFAIFFKLVMKKFNEQNLLLTSLLYDIFWPPVAAIILLGNLTKKKHPKWK